MKYHLHQEYVIESKGLAPFVVRGTADLDNLLSLASAGHYSGRDMTITGKAGLLDSGHLSESVNRDFQSLRWRLADNG